MKLEQYITISDVQKFMLENGVVWNGEMIAPYTYMYKYKKAYRSDLLRTLIGLEVDVIFVDTKELKTMFLKVGNLDFKLLSRASALDESDGDVLDLSDKWIKYLLKTHGSDYQTTLKNHIEKQKKEIKTYINNELRPLQKQIKVIKRFAESKYKKISQLEKLMEQKTTENEL